MIRIHKHGKHFEKEYLAECTDCGCQFWFDRNDYKGENGKAVVIHCPECDKVICGTYLGDIALVAQYKDCEVTP